MARLNTAKLRTLTKPGTYGDGAGLYLQVRGPSQRSWVFRFKIGGQGHLMGLGAHPEVGLAEARDAATAARRAVRGGVNPIDQRKAERADVAARAGLNTFSEVAQAYIQSHGDGWRNAKHRAQWVNTLETYAAPIIGKLPVAQVDVGAVMRVLEPIWREKPETASRLRGRIEATLDYAAARGWRTGDNPARWRGHIQNLLPARAKLARVAHHPALPWREMGAFMAMLRDQDGAAALALEFVILTAARTSEVLGARWCEMDIHAGVWSVPGERMKAGREHRVPLSPAALNVLGRAAKLLATRDKGDAFVFPGRSAGKGLSSMALLMLLRRSERGDLTSHGFRSSFRDWCAEATNYPRELAEAALAHVIRDKTEAAYQRGDLLEKRRRLMEDWAGFCARPAVPAGKVVALYGT
jgi:integrase